MRPKSWCKRALVTGETRGLRFFLATINESISSVRLTEMAKNQIHLVVPHNLKESTKLYKVVANVKTFEEFFEQYLDPVLKRWMSSRVV